MPESKDLFGNPIHEDTAPKKVKGNPMVAVHGSKPPFQCKECRHLYYKQFSKRYYKCAHRKNTNGPATDHKVSWPACGLFEFAEGEKPRGHVD